MNLLILLSFFIRMELGISLAAAPSNTSGASTSTPPLPKNHPKLQPETEIKVSQDKKIKAKDYFVPCGQACSFQAATETMSILGHYFMTYKETSKELIKDSRFKENIKNCTQNLPNCDKEDLLNSSLHYAAGKFIRNAIVENQTNQQDIKSLGCEDHNKDSPQCKDQVEGLDYKWFRGESTYKEITPKLRLDIQEHKDRDNFQFDLNDFEAETFKNKLRELDPEMYKEYNKFFNEYVSPNDRLFSKALKKAEDNSAGAASRKLASASKDADQYRFESDKNGQNILHEDLRKEVQDGHKGSFAQLKEARDEALKKGYQFQTGKETIEKPPVIFNNDDNFIEHKIVTLHKIIERASKQNGNAPLNENEKQPLRAAGISEGALRNNQFIKKEAEAKLKQYEEILKKDQEKDPIANSRKIAEEINRQVAEQVKNLKEKDPKTLPTLQIDINAFDDFLDQIWPTDAAGRLLQDFRKKQSDDTKALTQGLH